MRIGSALSGLLMVLFLVVHLAGLLPALIAPAQFEHYATALHHQPWLPVLEAGLAATALLSRESPGYSLSAYGRVRGWRSGAPFAFQSTA